MIFDHFLIESLFSVVLEQAFVLGEWRFRARIDEFGFKKDCNGRLHATTTHQNRVF